MSKVPGISAIMAGAGLWEPGERRITIKRRQLRNVVAFAGTLLHEITHAFTGADDESMEFEDGLTRMLGQLTSYAMNMNQPKILRII